MNPVKIFGTHLRPTHEYVGWLQTEEGISLLEKSITEWHRESNSILGSFAMVKDEILSEAHTFLSEPNQLSDWVRGEEPIRGDGMYEQPEQLFLSKLKQWQNHQPLYKGEWEVVASKEVNGDEEVMEILYQGKFIGYLKGFETRNDFATHCMSLGFLPKLNDIEI